MKPKFLLCLALVLGGRIVDAGDFTVSIVGRLQSHGGQYKEEGVPLVFCPQSPSVPANAHGVHKTSGNEFYVVIQSTQTNAETIKMASSDWYECLRFKIIDGSGKVYSVSRQPIAWSANVRESWTFSNGGLRVFAVDFTSNVSVGPMTGWQGLPPAPSVPEVVSMTATFFYGGHSEGQKIVASEPTRVFLCETSN